MYNPINTNLINSVIYFASILRPDTYLELGLDKAETISKVRKYTKQAIGVDINKPENTVGFTFYQMDTDSFFAKIKCKEIIIPTLDMVFIDAYHSYEQSSRDFNNAFEYLSDNGLIFLHDTYPKNEFFTDQGYCGDSYKTAWHIRMLRVSCCEIVTIPCHPGISIVRKCSKQLPWK